MRNAQLYSMLLFGSLSICLSTSFSQSGWFSQNHLLNGNSLLTVSFADSSTGTAVGKGSTILHTTKGGLTWRRQASGTTQNFYGVSFTNVCRGIAVAHVTEYGDPFKKGGQRHENTWQ